MSYPKMNPPKETTRVTSIVKPVILGGFGWSLFSRSGSAAVAVAFAVPSGSAGAGTPVGATPETAFMVVGLSSTTLGVGVSVAMLAVEIQAQSCLKREMWFWMEWD